MSILIVDHSPEVCQRLKDALGAVGYQDVWTAGHAAEALGLLGIPGGPTKVPDLDVILLDLHLPELDGIQACRRIKAAEELRDVPIIIMDGATGEGSLEAAFAAGATDFLAKPIKIMELLVRLRAAMALKRELDARKAREQELLVVTRKLQEANQVLQRISTQDGLTGLSNRRYFDLFLSKEWSRCMRDDVPLCLVLIDIDHFKTYNDCYGHQAGDECLRRVAEEMARVLKRPGDLAARYGGEEFALVLPRTKPEGARAIAEAVRMGVENLALPHARSPLGHVTISAGVAALIPERHSRPEILVRQADQALYQAKGQGRNRTEMAHDRTWHHDGGTQTAPPHAVLPVGTLTTPAQA
jgi:diguanylate cyclase (GGDEF)-like protein